MIILEMLSIANYSIS